MHSLTCSLVHSLPPPHSYGNAVQWELCWTASHAILHSRTSLRGLAHLCQRPVHDISLSEPVAYCFML
eukprot:5402828-Alexandrium_andersonii.AAC.1